MPPASTSASPSAGAARSPKGCGRARSGRMQASSDDVPKCGAKDTTDAAEIQFTTFYFRMPVQGRSARLLFDIIIIYLGVGRRSPREKVANGHPFAAGALYFSQGQSPAPAPDHEPPGVRHHGVTGRARLRGGVRFPYLERRSGHQPFGAGNGIEGAPHPFPDITGLRPIDSRVRPRAFARRASSRAALLRPTHVIESPS